MAADATAPGTRTCKDNQPRLIWLADWRRIRYERGLAATGHSPRRRLKLAPRVASNAAGAASEISLARDLQHVRDARVRSGHPDARSPAHHAPRTQRDLLWAV